VQRKSLQPFAVLFHFGLLVKADRNRQMKRQIVPWDIAPITCERVPTVRAACLPNDPKHLGRFPSRCWRRFNAVPVQRPHHPDPRQHLRDSPSTNQLPPSHRPTGSSETIALETDERVDQPLDQAEHVARA
jgi:hypothetical protein